MCYACLFKLHWEPEKFLSLSEADKAFIAAAFLARGESEDRQREEIESKRQRR